MSFPTSLISSAPQHQITRTPSNSSIASSSSGASLARRPGIRARSRSKTVAGNVKSSKTYSPEPPYLEKPYAPEPSSYTPQDLHLRPPEPDVFDTRDLRGRASGSLLGSTESGGQDVTIVADTQPSPMIAKVPKAAERASSLPDIVTSRSPPPSSFLRNAPLTPVANVRDSVSTHKSNTSSSVYPLSASSGLVSPISPTSLRPMSEDIEHFEVPHLEQEVEEDDNPGFDPDDVSYRLRLLVKNNYFLPPAHSKPMLSDRSPVEPKKSTRAATPTFLDIFNKLKPKPLSPVGVTFDPNLPLLRTTGDSITAPHALQSRPSMQMPRPGGSPNGVGSERTGRVVVVREKMENIVIAAKQAEQEMKTRSFRWEAEPLSVQVFDDIDPTDIVDVPPPPSSYPFPMQTSALHGLGVNESISAAVLAERLPPSSPGMSSIESAEDEWRRSLLQAAVHHSLENTADLSSYSHAINLSTPTDSSNPTYPRGVDVEASPTPDPRLRLGQRILQQPFSDSSESFHGEDRKDTGKTASNRSLTACATEYLSADSRLSSRPSSYFLARVETPSDPWTALTPPPPRKQVTPFISQSQSDLTTPTPTADPMEEPCRTSTPTLRKTVSTPLLSANRMTPPPLPPPDVYVQDSSRDLGGSHNTSREMERSQSAVTDSMYSDDDLVYRGGRASAALSALMSRPSLSDCSRESLSPTTSAFQDDLNNTIQAYPQLAMTFQAAQQARINRASSVSRDSAMSPPPRISSSLAHVALPPPPRHSSLRYPPATSQMDMKASLDSVINELVVPAPATPPKSLSERREDPPAASRTENNVEATLHAAPEPSSPTSFFDNIQSQPNALDDLDSSSDESEIMHDASFVDARSRTMSNVATPPRSSLMRLGNHSSPHMSRATRSTEEPRVPLPFGVQDPKQPIANVPHRNPFFAQQLSGKGDQSHGAPISSFDFYQYSKQHASGASIDASVPKPKRAASSSLEATTRNEPVDESLRRLDGLLQQHMVAEKDTIRRIATKTLQSSNAQRTLETK